MRSTTLRMAKTSNVSVLMSWPPSRPERRTLGRLAAAAAPAIASVITHVAMISSGADRQATATPRLAHAPWLFVPPPSIPRSPPSLSPAHLSHEPTPMRQNSAHGLPPGRAAAHRRALPRHGRSRPCCWPAAPARRWSSRSSSPTALTVAGAAMLNNCRRARRRHAHGAHAPAADGERPHPGRASTRRGTGAGGRRQPGPVGRGRRPRGGLRPARRRVLRASSYTLLLKPRTALSSIPGAVAGVFPALIGWAATGAGVVGRPPLPLRARLRLVAATLLGAGPRARGGLPGLGHPDAGGRLRRRRVPAAHRLVRGGRDGR